LQGLREAGERRTPGLHFLVLFLGSTIGNFDPQETAAFLSGVREALVPGDAFLLGADLEKADREMLLAYDDPAGVTAAFNRNLLARINRELGGDFAVSNYSHEARYDHARRRIEMHLRATAPQRVSIRGAGIEVGLKTGETIWTESSYKFRPGDIRRIAETAGFACAAQWIDEAWPFSENLLLPC
jgi:uncharacterized SAM-dependent methyltransferase